MNLQFTVRKATEADFPSILGMIRELALYEKAPEKVTNSLEQMHREKHLFGCFVAEVPGEGIVGMALYFFAYYTWVGKSLYLDDIYVKEPFRGMKIGAALLKEVFKVAEAEQCWRVKWQVLNWNTPAIEVYKRYGANLDDEWIDCVFDAEGIRRFIEENL
ncbi:MAG TPA: GNAT family N-acetyltransferase [Bacteroidales bacterium]|nr:GNAT family N-acetyltransferase [Bacteroidales bacterium]HRZ48530.1 GNAT family N-acetyltransferase [Bacteroidales bacterium]